MYLNYCRRGEPLGEAVAARRFHNQHLPDRIELETGVFPDDVKAALRAKGHTLYERASRYTEGRIGRVHAIAFEKDGSLTAAADPRSYGAAGGGRGAAA